MPTGRESFVTVREMPWLGVWPHAAAIAAITINPAEIFSLSDRIGRIGVGDRASLVVWSGDPLEPLSRPVAVFVDGNAMPLTARPLELGERYSAGKEIHPN